MARIAMLALKNFPFGGHNVRKGCEFIAPSNMAARFLVESKLADFAPSVNYPDPTPAAEPEQKPAAAPAPQPEAPAETPQPPEFNAPAEQGQEPAAETQAAEVEPRPEPIADVSSEPADESASHTEEQPADTELSPRTGKPKRAYRRRDMAAEGTEG